MAPGKRVCYSHLRSRRCSGILREGSKLQIVFFVFFLPYLPYLAFAFDPLAQQSSTSSPSVVFGVFRLVFPNSGMMNWIIWHFQLLDQRWLLKRIVQPLMSITRMRDSILIALSTLVPGQVRYIWFVLCLIACFRHVLHSIFYFFCADLLFQIITNIFILSAITAYYTCGTVSKTKKAS